MNCLKCGRECDQTFCEECREIMKKYPVKPGAIVQIPKGRMPKKPVPRRAPVSLQTQVAKQKKLIRSLLIVIACMLVVIGAMGFTIYHLWKGQHVRPVGQNYSTVTKRAEESLPVGNEK